MYRWFGIVVFTAAWLTLVLTQLSSALAVQATPSDDQAQMDSNGDDGLVPTDSGWPRTFEVEGNRYTVYQPQFKSWNNNLLRARAAVGVTTPGAAAPIYGIIQINCLTEIDKQQGIVVFRNVQVTSADFPAAKAQSDQFLAQLRTELSNRPVTASFARIEAALSVIKAVDQGHAQPVKNDPPRIIYSTKPALLVLVDGPAALRSTANADVLRVINTRALFLLQQSTATYYLRLLDGWQSAASLEGPWSYAASAPPAVADVMNALKDDESIDLLNDKSADGSDSAAPQATAQSITVFASTSPAELIQTQGPADLEPIDGTQILYVKNTHSQIFMYLTDQHFYVLLSGRWFKSMALDGGSWSYVDYAALPWDFAKIPETHPAGGSLVSVPGTPQAKEAAIANTIPQTAEVDRQMAQLTVSYDGDPKFAPIEPTSMQFAVNTATPVMQVREGSYFACDRAVWFSATAPAGPWIVATEVPAVIYTIPVSSPLHYVTYVRIHDYTAQTVYVGYTPGYLGTVLVPSGIVVYGTGYWYPPYIGTVWYGPPVTYGFGVGFACGSATGFAFGFAAGFGLGFWWHPWWGPWHHWGWWGGGWNMHVSINHINIYRHWNRDVIHPHVVYSKHDGKNDQKPDHAIPGDNKNKDGRPSADDRTLENERAREASQRNNIYAGRDNHIYRHNDGGDWERRDHASGQWNRPSDNDPSWMNERAALERDSRARNFGERRSWNAPREGGWSRGGGWGGGEPGGGNFRGGGGGHGGGRR